MENLKKDSSKIILTIAFSLSLLLCSSSLFLFSLSAVSKSMASSKSNYENLQIPKDVDGYQMVGFDAKTSSVVGFNKNKNVNHRIEYFK